MNKNGVRWEKPVYTIDKLGTPAIPRLRITHHGYVNLKDRKILPLGSLIGCDNDLKKDTKAGIRVIFFWRFFILFF